MNKGHAKGRKELRAKFSQVTYQVRWHQFRLFTCPNEALLPSAHIFLSFRCCCHSKSFILLKQKKSLPELLYVYWFGWFAACVTQSIINLIQRAPFERLWLSTISSVTLGFRVQKVQIAQTKGPYSPWFNSSSLTNNCCMAIILELNQNKNGRKLLGYFQDIFLIS